MIHAPAINVDINQWPEVRAIQQRKPKEDEYPPGRFSFGTSILGGPQFTDAFKSRQAPSLTQLVENYHALIYAMVARNRNAVARLPMRLLADGSRVQGKPSRASDPIKVSRAVGKQLAESGQVSTAAIDQIYEIRNHPLLDTLDNPDPYGTFTREKLIGLLVSYMDVVGSGYLVPEGNGWDWRKDGPIKDKGPPDNLWIVYPQYIIPVRNAASPIISFFQYFADRLPYDSVIWFRHNHSLRDAYGAAFSPTYAGEPYRKQEQEQIAILSQVLGLGPRPNMIATAKDPLMPPGESEARAFSQDLVRQQGGGYAGGILVNRAGWDFTPINYAPADLAGKDISEYDIYALAAIFDQPATYYTVESNLANLQAADKEHWLQGVEPRCKTVAGQFTRLAKAFDPRLMFKFDHGLNEDELVKAQVDKIYVDMGAITLNELNEEKKYDKKPWGDEPWLPSTLVQPSMAQETHEQALEQGAAVVESQGLQNKLAVGDQKHGQKMDLKGHELEKKKAAQAAKAKQERAIMDLAETVLRGVESELKRMAS